MDKKREQEVPEANRSNSANIDFLSVISVFLLSSGSVWAFLGFRHDDMTGSVAGASMLLTSGLYAIASKIKK